MKDTTNDFSYLNKYYESTFGSTNLVRVFDELPSEKEVGK
jgi:hypothetical protein